MKRMMWLVIGGVGLLLITFQNCSRVGFGQQGQASNAANQNPSASSSLSVPNDVTSSDPSTPSTPGTPSTPSGPIGPAVPPAKIPDFSCQKFQILPLSKNLQIPARDSQGTCYAVQLMGAIDSSPSNLTTTSDDEVISRDHDQTASDPSLTHHPYLMGQATVNLTLGGPRRLKLAGAANTTTPILVDNFVMVGFGIPASQGSADSVELIPTDYAAYGTSDSTVEQTNGVLLNSTVVALTPFASGGTATVTPLDISQTIEANQPYILDVRAEDCGKVRQLSDIYLIIQ
jgi:hypothetical protein